MSSAGGLGAEVTYRLVGGGRSGQLGGLPSSHWLLEVVVEALQEGGS